MSNEKKPVIRIPDVLDLLKQGKTREEIRLHYGLTKSDLKLLFKHEKLKYRKRHTSAVPGFILVDPEEEPKDLPEEMSNTHTTNEIEDSEQGENEETEEDSFIDEIEKWD